LKCLCRQSGQSCIYTHTKRKGEINEFEENSCSLSLGLSNNNWLGSEEGRSRDHDLYEYFVSRGYVVARVDIRGTGNSGGIIEDEWTFTGPDQESTVLSGQQVTYTPAAPGEYTVRLEVVDDEGARDSTSKTFHVTPPHKEPCPGRCFGRTLPETGDELRCAGRPPLVRSWGARTVGRAAVTA